jgi:uncharacterized 2Fe-2S/4Fe-4S cluster protein (DUF4445 family)
VEVEGSCSERLESEKKFSLPPGTRLACQTTITGPLTARYYIKSGFKSIKSLELNLPPNTSPSLKYIDAPILDRYEQRPLIEVLSLKADSLSALIATAEVQATGAPAKALVWQDRLLNVWPKEKAPKEILGLAFDLGTTGLALAVIDLNSGRLKSTQSSLNPQAATGADVISRITYASISKENLKVIQELAIKGFRELLEISLPMESRKQVGAVTVSGNTTMLHLLAGLNPASLAQAPYRPIFLNSIDISQLNEAMGLNPWAKVLTLPSMSSFVGGDIASGLLATDLEKRPGATLFIDIGTNGEIVLSRQGQLVATSCAAGPALEGMNITCGLRAVTGAVDSFRLRENMEGEFTTIGGGTALGLCGSGLLDLVSELVKGSIINPSGRLINPSANPPNRYYLTPEVYLSQKDVRQVQLCKGAVAAAVELLLKKMNLEAKELDEVVVAGSFGYHLKPESLKGVGLIPLDYQGPVTFVGNSSLAGAARALLDSTTFEQLERVARKTQVIELSFDSDFQDAFVRHLNF